MEFKGPYLFAMREQAPKMFNRLRRTGAMDAHLQEKSIEAHRMLEELTATAPKHSNGLTKEPWLREAKEQVFAALIEFPSEEPEPADTLRKLPERTSLRNPYAALANVAEMLAKDETGVNRAQRRREARRLRDLARREPPPE